jgi:hypothetical protein
MKNVIKRGLIIDPVTKIKTEVNPITAAVIIVCS